MEKDYKKMYEDALERAKGLKTDACKDVAEYIFPELLESEDEKIRKYIIWHLKHTRTYLDNSVNNHVEEAIAWLEKQGKKLPIDWNEKIKGLDELETYILSLDPNRSLDAVKVDAKNIRFWANKDENKYDKGFNDGFSASEHNKRLTEEDIRHIDNIIGCLEEFLNPGFPIYKGGVFKEIKWLENLKNNK